MFRGARFTPMGGSMVAPSKSYERGQKVKRFAAGRWFGTWCWFQRMARIIRCVQAVVRLDLCSGEQRAKGVTLLRAKGMVSSLTQPGGGGGGGGAYQCR